MHDEYQMPVIALGTPVLFYEQANTNRRPMPGIVSAVNARNLCVSAISQENHNLLIRDGVRHVSDPLLKANPHAREDGAWDFHPDTIRLRAVEEQVAGLLRELDPHNARLLAQVK